MKKLLFALLTLAGMLSTDAALAQKTKYKCMVQMTNYPGEGAYIAVSLIDPKGNYERTLYVFGQDKKWYPDLTEWHKAQKKKPSDLSAITGASMPGGERKVAVIEIEDAKVDAGYAIRFESGVENQKYHVKDIEVPLTKEALSGKTEGSNYIRSVRFSPN